MILWWLEEGYAHVFMSQFQEKSSLSFGNYIINVLLMPNKNAKDS